MVKVQLVCHVHPMEGELCLDFKILVFAQVKFSALPDANWQADTFLCYVACMLTGCHARQLVEAETTGTTFPTCSFSS